jgi:hypothetical protein
MNLVQGYLAHKKPATPLGHPYGPRHGPTVGSYGAAVSYERGTPVQSVATVSVKVLQLDVKTETKTKVH